MILNRKVHQEVDLVQETGLPAVALPLQEGRIAKVGDLQVEGQALVDHAQVLAVVDRALVDLVVEGPLLVDLVEVMVVDLQVEVEVEIEVAVAAEVALTVNFLLGKYRI